MRQYLTETGGHFIGRVIAEIKEGRATYSGDTLAELRDANPTASLVDDGTLCAMYAAYYASLVTEREEITEDRYFELLGCLPPCKFTRFDKGGECFYISERLTGNLVEWCGIWQGKHYTFTDQASRPLDEIINKFKGA